MHFHCHQSSGTLPGAVMANPSLNRTLCGGPSLGSKSLAQTRPTAKCRLARTLAITGKAPVQSSIQSKQPACGKSWLLRKQIANTKWSAFFTTNGDRRTGKPVAGWRFARASYAVMPVSKPLRNVAGINLLPQNQLSRLTEGETHFGRYITQRQQSTRLLFWLQQ